MTTNSLWERGYVYYKVVNTFWGEGGWIVSIAVNRNVGEGADSSLNIQLKILIVSFYLDNSLLSCVLIFKISKLVSFSCKQPV